jgi:hypothetical protein
MKPPVVVFEKFSKPEHSIRVYANVFLGLIFWTRAQKNNFFCGLDRLLGIESKTFFGLNIISNPYHQYSHNQTKIFQTQVILSPMEQFLL